MRRQANAYSGPVQNDLRVMHGIEQALKRAAGTAYSEYNKEEIKSHLLEVQKIIGLPFGEDPSAHAPHLTPLGLHPTTTTPAPETGTPSISFAFAPADFVSGTVCPQTPLSRTM